MSLVQFLRVLWARRALIVAATVSCVAGAYLVTLIVPPRWESHVRVLLDTLKPDPITGVVIAGPADRGYIATQTELITDYTVAERVAEQLGWQSSPALIAKYNSRPKSDARDFKRWLAQRVIDRTKAKVLEGSNILEISYRGSTPDEAKQVADALRKAYIDVSLSFKQDDATRDALWYEAQAQKAKISLDAAEKAENDFERANGVVMADEKTDVETARLRALSSQGLMASPVVTAVPTASPSAIQLAQLDAQIAQASQTLGPNHPELQQLRAQRAGLARLVEQDEANARASVAASSSAGAGALEHAVAAQTARVIAQGEKLKGLDELQSEVDLRRDQFEKSSAKAAELRQVAAEADVGLTPLAAAVTPQSPKFPNMLLIIPGSFVLGLAMGVLAALLLELLGRRIRGQEDLESAIDAPLLAVIPGATEQGRMSALGWRWWPAQLDRIRLAMQS